MGCRSGEHFTVLVVCVGNVCRSPALECLLHSAFREGDDGVAVHSAGTRALVGQPAQPRMVRLIERNGGNVDSFAARAVTGPMLADADLVLTATRELRGDVVEILPSAVRRTFTVREFARLAALVRPLDLDSTAPPEGDLSARLEALVPLAAARRTEVRIELDDILDPYGQSEEAYEQSYDQIVEAVETISRVVLESRRVLV